MMPVMEPVTLHRPVGPVELKLIEASGWREFPTRGRHSGGLRGPELDMSGLHIRMKLSLRPGGPLAHRSFAQTRA
jgi:hypothetical protein